MLCSVIEHGMTSFEFSNCRTEERIETEFFCKDWKRNGVIPCYIFQQSTTSYVLSVLEHSYIQNQVKACTVCWQCTACKMGNIWFYVLEVFEVCSQTLCAFLVSTSVIHVKSCLEWLIDYAKITWIRNWYDCFKISYTCHVLLDKEPTFPCTRAISLKFYWVYLWIPF